MHRDPVRSSRLPCHNFIDTSPPPRDYHVLLGVAALPTAPRTAALQTGRTGDSDPATRLFAKTGLLIRNWTSFSLVVPPELIGRLAIGWANGPATPHDRVIVRCDVRTGDRSGWLAYPGGFWVPHPACVSLLIETATRRQRVRIGLGTPCPGQKPPQGPTQS